MATITSDPFRTPQPPNQLFAGLAVALPVCLLGWVVVTALVIWMLA